MKKNDAATLKKKLWVIFSQFVRRRDDGTCISCGIKKPWKEQDAGHYYARTFGLSLFFHEKNVNTQCTACNRFRHGNLARYAVGLKKKYGDRILDELEVISKQHRSIGVKEYRELIKEYKTKLEALPKRECDTIDYND